MGFGNFIDDIGTNLNLPELGISEWLAGGNRTSNTGRVEMQDLNTPLGKNKSGQYQAWEQAMGQPVSSGSAPKAAHDGTKVTNGTGTVLGASSSAPSYSAADLAGLNQSESLLNNSLGRIDGQLGIALENIGKQFGVSQNELQTGFNQNKNTYDTSTTQNAQSLRTNKNTIADQASSGLRGLMRLLGSYGAVGSDLGLAGSAVADQASQQRAGASQTFAQNQQNLDTNWGNYQGQFENEKRKLDDWRTQQEDKSRQSSASNKQNILQQLAEVARQRSSLLGGGNVSAQNYINQANALSGQIDELGRLNPTYTGNTPTYTAAPLSSYENNAKTTATIEDLGSTAGSNNPYLSMLLGNKDKKTIF